MKLFSRRRFLNTAAASAGLIAMPRITTATTASHIGDQEKGIISACKMIEVIARKTLPEGAWLKGASFTCVSGGMEEDSIWLSAIDVDHRLIHMRPTVRGGWFEGTY